MTARGGNARILLDVVETEEAVEIGPEEGCEQHHFRGNEEDHAASGHWGVPTFVFEKEPFFGQDRIDLLLWRMEQKGLRRRATSA